MAIIDTVFGRFLSPSRGRLDLTYDYETSAIFSFFDIAKLIEATAVVDVGANIGVYSIFCLQLPKVDEIHAFEPAPAAFDLLKQNVDEQPRRDIIRIYKVAASDAKGTIEFNIVNAMSGANAVATSESKGERVRVEADLLDNLVHFSRKRIAVKVDVEGHEMSTLAGMRNVFASNDCYVQVESLRPDRVAELRKFMWEIGYTYIFSVRDDHLFAAPGIGNIVPDILEIISKAVSEDLRHLVILRRQKRSIALAARRLREMSGYRTDPLFLGRDESPF